MNLTPREKDKLLISMAAMVARRRLERGVKLNYPEAIARTLDHEVGDKRDGFRVVQLDAALEPAPRHDGGHGDEQLVLLARRQIHAVTFSSLCSSSSAVSSSEVSTSSSSSVSDSSLSSSSSSTLAYS